MAKKSVLKSVPKEPSLRLVADYDTVIARPVPKAEKSHGGIYIPQSVDQEKMEDIRHATIILVGPNSNPNRPFIFNIGDIISHGEYTGRRFIYEGEELVVMKHLDVLMGQVEN
jgi:co-chaperonin GroES (HSP10)